MNNKLNVQKFISPCLSTVEQLNFKKQRTVSTVSVRAQGFSEVLRICITKSHLPFLLIALILLSNPHAYLNILSWRK